MEINICSIVRKVNIISALFALYLVYVGDVAFALSILVFMTFMYELRDMLTHGHMTEIMRESDKRFVKHTEMMSRADIEGMKNGKENPFLDTMLEFIDERDKKKKAKDNHSPAFDELMELYKEQIDKNGE